MTTEVGSTPADACFPLPKSSYYFGPPDATRAFGQPVTGTIGRHHPKEIIRIERDYSEGELPQFHSSFPLELEGRISPTAFGELVNDMNALLIEAHAVGKMWRDNIMAILTFYLTSALFSTHYRRTMDKLTALIQTANSEVLNPRGLHLVHPRNTAFLFCELEYY